MKIWAPFHRAFAYVFNHYPMLVFRWSNKGLWTHTTDEIVDHTWFSFSVMTSSRKSDPVVLQLVFFKLLLGVAWCRDER